MKSIQASVSLLTDEICFPIVAASLGPTEHLKFIIGAGSSTSFGHEVQSTWNRVCEMQKGTPLTGWSHCIVMCSAGIDFLSLPGLRHLRLLRLISAGWSSSPQLLLLLKVWLQETPPTSVTTEASLGLRTQRTD